MDANPKTEYQTEKVSAGSAVGTALPCASERQAMAVVALSHTKLEQKIYQIMFDETRNLKTRVGEFGIQYLIERAETDSYNRVQRARRGLILKMSIEALTVVSQTRQLSIYTVYGPTEILERRRAKKTESPKWFRDDEKPDSSSWNVIERIVENKSLSRREAQVTLHCAEGMTNHEIGEKLFIHEETVKFHLRNIFLKLGVRRRTELIAHLFKN